MEVLETRKKNKRRWRYASASSGRMAFGLLLPTFILVGFIVIYPLIAAVRLSFLNYKLTEPGEIHFIFVRNYLNMITDRIFWIAIKNTLLFTFCTVSIGFLLGLFMALVIKELQTKYRSLRALFLIPWVIAGVVIGYLFMYMLDVEIGILNYILKKMGIIESFLPWLMRADLAMAAIIVTHVWNQAPFFMIMLTAGLMAIPEEAREAAYLEGANRFQEFRFITIAYLTNVILVSTLLMIIRNFNYFPIIYTMTGGGPGYATTTMVLHIFTTAFEKFNMGSASAIGTTWLFILICLSMLYTRMMKESF